MANKFRPILPWGNNIHLNIQMKRFDKASGEYTDFDLTQVSDLSVKLICSKHSTIIDIPFNIKHGYTNILECVVDYKLVHIGASYGIVVEGFDENNEHFRFEMLPSEGFLIIANTSGMKPTDDAYTIDISARCGWGIEAVVHADWAETDPEADSYIENKPDIDGMIDSALENYYDKTETDDLLDNKADAADLANKQDVLVSGTNIKTINNQSLLGSGNIDIQGGGGTTYTAGDNIDITNNTISLEDDIYLNTVNASNINIYNRIDYVKWYDGDHRYLAQQAMEGNQYRIGFNWANHQGYTLYVNTQDGLVTIGGEWVYTDQNIPSYVQPQDNVYVTASTVINGEPIYGVYNHDSDSPDFFIYDDNYTITEVYAEYKFMNQADWNESNPESPAYINNKPDIPNYTGGNSIVIDQTTQEVSLQEVVNAKYISVKKIYNGGEIYQIDYARWADTPCRYLAPGALDNTQYRIGNQWYGWDRYYNLIIETESHGTSTFNETWVRAVSLPAWLGGGDPSGWFYTSNFTVNGEPVYGVYNPDSDSPDFYIYDADNYDITHMYVVYTYPSQLLHANWNENDYNSPSFIEGKPNLSNYATQSDLANKQDVLVSGTNIKTINNQSILGSGDITISGGGVQSDWNESDSSSLAYILNKPTIPAAQVQSDWNETDNTSLAYIQNKPTIQEPGFVPYTKNNKTGYIAKNLEGITKIEIGNGAIVHGSSSNLGIYHTKATGDQSHCEGQDCTSSGNLSHAEGCSTEATNFLEHAEGYYNISTMVNKTYWTGDNTATLHSIGNGNGTQRHNAFEIKQNGDIYYSDTEKIDGSTVYYYTAPMRKLQDVMVTSSSVNGMKIEVVSALPSSPDSNTVYLVV